uniref:ABC transmembrane type-1 domain-containing protein n=1 Tax=Rhabditophanes sp. KR3021 TaxID=114890 RepID=A0AC35TVU9_9BILA
MKPIKCNDMSILKKFYPSTVSSKHLVVGTLIAPLCVMGFVTFVMFPRRMRAETRSRCFSRFSTELIFHYVPYVVVYALLVISLEFIKCYSAVKRPHFIEVCKPDMSHCMTSLPSDIIESQVGDHLLAKNDPGKMDADIAQKSNDADWEDEKSDSDYLNNVDKANWLSFSTFSWILPYLIKIKSKKVETNSTFSVPLFDTTNVNVQLLERIWKNELKNKPENPSFMRCVMRMFRRRLIISCFIFAFCLIFGFIGPTCFVRSIIHFAEEPPKLPDSSIDYRMGYFFVGALFIVEFMRVISYGATWAVSYRSGLRIRGAILGLLYKSLLGVRSLKGKTASEIVNIYANDGQRIFDAVTFAPLVMIGPLVLVGGIIYLWYKIGWLCILGMIVFLACDLLQAFLGITMVRSRASAIKTTEERMSLMGEIIRCIRVIKMNAWEDLFIEKVEVLRTEEQKWLKKAGYAQSLAIAFGSIVPVLAMIITVLGVVMNGKDLSASDAFSMITVYFVMLFGIRMIPYGARYLSEAIVSMRRIQRILMFPKAEAFDQLQRNPEIAVVMKNASFEYDKVDVEPPPTKRGEEKTSEETVELTTKDEGNSFTLAGLTLNIQKQELIGVCGPVGCGKSSLLTAILGHMQELSGDTRINGTCVHVGQETCLQATSVRKNILFGSFVNQTLYKKALEASELVQDLERFPAKDLTEVGERGTTLSGGQQIRVCLARALFANKDVYLLDDIFSALDRKVCEKIFNNAVLGMLKSKTVVLVSSNPEYLAQCDKVVYMDSGRIVDIASHDDLVAKNDSYKNFFSTLTARKDFVDQVTSDLVDVEKEEETTMPALPIIPTENNKIMSEEEDYGLDGISAKVYHEYIIAAGGYVLFALLVSIFIINVAATIFSTLWLTKWMKSSHDQFGFDSNNNTIKKYASLSENPDTTYYATIYFVSLILLFASALIKAMAFVKISLKASTNLHNRMLSSILHGVVRFFDQTPVGRILNRFSKDVDEVDVKLPFSSEALLQNMITCIGFLATIAWVFPLFILVVIPFMVLFAIFFRVFQAGIRSLKRTENLSRSPLFEHITASMEGIYTINAFHQKENFINKFNKKMDENSGAMFMFQAATRWQAVWLDLLVVSITAIVAAFIIFLTGTVNPAEAGMALAFAIQMSGIFQFAVRSQTELEAKLTSVERISYYYTNVDQETRENPRSVPPHWPTAGAIKFEKLRMRYRVNMNLALDDVSLEIDSKDRVGVVGRTGAGKSSVCNALLQLYPLQNGRILIDNVDISDIDLKRLRNAITIIPQEPVLFNGSVRFNIDPKKEHNDQEVWDALEKANMKKTINSLTEKLDHKIEENGSNFSSGERQLLCLARSVLKQTKIIILDEPSASLDESTDALVSQCVNKNFNDCTLLLIAHRLGKYIFLIYLTNFTFILGSVLKMDKILSMGDGKILEYDYTQKLVQDKESHFRAMLTGTNLIVESDKDETSIHEFGDKVNSTVGNEIASEIEFDLNLEKDLKIQKEIDEAIREELEGDVKEASSPSIKDVSLLGDDSGEEDQAKGNSSTESSLFEKVGDKKKESSNESLSFEKVDDEGHKNEL